MVVLGLNVDKTGTVRRTAGVLSDADTGYSESVYATGGQTVLCY